MRNKLKSSKGFTLIELVLVIVILGIMAAVAIPRFYDMSTRAKQSARDGVAGAVRAAIQQYKANDLVTVGPPGNYPATLDAAADGSTTDTSGIALFGSIVENGGITSKGWTRVSATSYTFNDGTTTHTYTYSPAAGTFTSPTAP